MPTKPYVSIHTIRSRFATVRVKLRLPAVTCDPEVFTNPAEFNARRNVEYLHFGYGMHTCFGKAINDVQIPELLAALLRLPNLRRAPGSAGHILYDGPFPNRLVLEFDA